MVAGTAPDSLYGICESMWRPDMVRAWHGCSGGSRGWRRGGGSRDGSGSRRSWRLHALSMPVFRSKGQAVWPCLAVPACASRHVCLSCLLRTSRCDSRVVHAACRRRRSCSRPCRSACSPAATATHCPAGAPSSTSCARALGMPAPSAPAACPKLSAGLLCQCGALQHTRALAGAAGACWLRQTSCAATSSMWPVRQWLCDAEHWSLPAVLHGRLAAVGKGHPAHVACAAFTRTLRCVLLAGGLLTDSQRAPPLCVSAYLRVGAATMPQEQHVLTALCCVRAAPRTRSSRARSRAAWTDDYAGAALLGRGLTLLGRLLLYAWAAPSNEDRRLQTECAWSVSALQYEAACG
jgi:hypothetical protein